jgi:hypothetical protein
VLTLNCLVGEDRQYENSSLTTFVLERVETNRVQWEGKVPCWKRKRALEAC